MAYTVIEVERKTGVPSTTLKFWIKKGLFPNLERDKNGVRYFSEQDVLWVRWIEYFRFTKMPIAAVKHYIDLYGKGDSTFEERKQIIKNQRDFILKDMEHAQEILEAIENKLRLYEETRGDLQCRKVAKKPAKAAKIAQDDDAKTSKIKVGKTRKAASARTAS